VTFQFFSWGGARFCTGRYFSAFKIMTAYDAGRAAVNLVDNYFDESGVNL
jgi:hypothetical protein